MKSISRWLLASVLIASLGMSVKAAGVTDLMDLCTGANNSNCPFKVDSTGLIVSSATGTNTIAGSLSTTGTTTIIGKTVYTPTSVTSISSNTTISPTATYLLVLSTGNNVTCGLTALPLVAPCISTATATNGQYLVIGSTSSTSSVTFADGTTSGMQLGSATRLVDNLKKLTLIFDSFDSQWKEVSFGNN